METTQTGSGGTGGGMARERERTTQAGQQPSVGRIVHYGGLRKNGEVTAVAAIITRAEEGSTSVGLKIFNPDDSDRNIQRVDYATELTQNCWTFPPRV